MNKVKFKTEYTKPASKSAQSQFAQSTKMAERANVGSEGRNNPSRES